MSNVSVTHGDYKTLPNPVKRVLAPRAGQRVELSIGKDGQPVSFFFLPLCLLPSPSFFRKLITVGVPLFRSSSTSSEAFREVGVVGWRLGEVNRAVFCTQEPS